MGAKLKCTRGSEDGFLITTGNASISGMPMATVADTAVAANILGFGTCIKHGAPCLTLMNPAPEWDNTENVQFSTGGKMAVTTNSYLFCNSVGGIIRPLTSGQDDAYFEEFLQEMLRMAALENRFGEVFQILDHAFASLFLHEGMREMALRFLDYMIGLRGGQINIIPLFDDPHNVLDQRILQAIIKLAAAHGVRGPYGLATFLEDVITRSRVTNGADPRILDKLLLEVLDVDSQRRADLIAEGGLRGRRLLWQEENLQLLSFAASTAETIGFAAVGVATGASGARASGRKPSGGGVVQAPGGGIQNLDELISNPKKLGNNTPEGWNQYLKQNGHNPQPLGRGSQAGKTFEQGGGYRVNWGGDRIFQYHPSGTHHGGKPYYKLSSGPTGTNRYDLNGNPLDR